MQLHKLRSFVFCGISLLATMSGVAIVFFVLWFKIDSIWDLWMVRLLNILTGLLFATVFVLVRTRFLFANPLQMSIRLLIMTLGVFTITFGCLELWCETIVRARWFTSAEIITKNRIAITRVGLYNYSRDCGSFPTQDQGLIALIRNPGNPKWQGPYASLKDIDDYWGNQLRFHVIDGRVEVWSMGSDGRDGTDDDIRLPP